MPNEMEIMAYIDRRVMIPAPGERFLGEYIRSDVIHSLNVREAWIILKHGVDKNVADNTITIGVSHAIAW